MNWLSEASTRIVRSRPDYLSATGRRLQEKVIAKRLKRLEAELMIDPRLTRLGEIADLEDGWLGTEEFGSHGDAVSSEALRTATDWLPMLPANVYIYPTIEGGIQFEFDDEDNSMEWEVFPDGTRDVYDFLREDDDQPSADGDWSSL